VFGGNLAALAAGNGWAGLVINGCVRDSGEIDARTSACARWRSIHGDRPSAVKASAMLP